MRTFIVKLPIAPQQIAKLTITAPGWFEAMSIALMRYPSIAPRAISIKPVLGAAA